MPDSEKYSILISGACGFIGEHIVNDLLSTTDADLLICCRDKKGFPKTNQRLKLFQADLLRPNSFGSIFQQYKPRHIIHLAALARLKQGEEHPKLAVQTNFFGSRFLIDLAIKYKADSFVLLSSNLARKPKSVVGITKLLTEYYIQQKDDTHTRLMTLRLPNVPDSPASVTLIFKRKIENNEDVTITNPEMSRVFASLDEAGLFIQHILQNGKNKDTFVVTKKPTKITELAQEMIQASGKDIGIKHIGMQPGEKLEEEPYPTQFLEETPIDGLSLLNNKTQSTEELSNSLSILQRKIPPGKAGLKTIKRIEKVLSLK